MATNLGERKLWFKACLTLLKNFVSRFVRAKEMKNNFFRFVYLDCFLRLKVFFEWNIISLNLELSFSKIGCSTKAKELKLPYYLSISGRSWDTCFSQRYLCKMKHKHPHPGFEIDTLVTVITRKIYKITKLYILKPLGYAGRQKNVSAKTLKSRE